MWGKETNGVVVVAPIVVGPLFRLERVRSKHGRPWGEFAEWSSYPKGRCLSQKKFYLRISGISYQAGQLRDDPGFV